MYLEAQEAGIAVRIKVIPKASRNEIVGTRGDCLCIKICAPPEKGRANLELLRFLGKTLGCPPTSLHIVRGATSREKTVLIPLHDLASIRDRLEGRTPAR